MVRAGISQVDVTPPLGIGMRGYFEERTATTVHDPLYVRSFALESDSGAVAIATCDIIGVNRTYLDRAKERIVETTGLGPEQVLISCTHTHTGPHTGDDPYTEFLVGRIADGVRIAWDRREPAHVGWGRGSESRVVFNRRYRMADGSVQTNPGIGNPDVVEPAGPVDPEVGVLVLRNAQGRTLGVLANYALHYVGIPDDHHAISADYFGFFSSLIQRMRGESFVAALANGASGDINNLDVLGGARPANDHYQHTERVAALVAAAALWGWNEAQFCDDLQIGSALTEVTLQPRPPATEEDLARAEEIESRLAEGKPVLMGERSFARRVRRMAESPPEPRQTVVQALRIGELGIAGAPGEFFCELGLQIKDRSPFAQTMVLELANDSVGYIPTRRAFEEGAYEPESSSWAPGFGEEIVEAAVGMLEGLHGA
ncbi:MAG: neutral/alkaline non-lysosomal ceramidase N-terminal domain-containing protein [Armatimonadota bacterium]